MRFFAAFLLAAISFPTFARCQGPQECLLSTPKVCVLHVVQDQVGILASPSRTTTKDLFWLVPFGVATGVAIDYDAHAMRSLGVDPKREDHFNTISNFGAIYVPVAAIGTGYFVGNVTHNDLMRETAVLSTEAAVDSLIVDEGLKYAIERQRPNQGDGTGRFWPDGLNGWPGDPSMPSGHSMVAWSIAHVIATQYNGPATKAVAYSLATTVSVSRVLARQHFPSDVLVGSVFGYLIGGYVESRRSREAGRVSLSTVDTPNGRGLQLSYNFAR